LIGLPTIQPTRPYRFKRLHYRFRKPSPLKVGSPIKSANDEGISFRDNTERAEEWILKQVQDDGWVQDDD